MKRITLRMIALTVCLASVFALVACTFDVESTSDVTADGKTDSVALLNAFFEEVLKDPNLVAVYKSGDEVQFTENLKGTASVVESKDGMTVYTYKTGETYNYAFASEDSRYYFTSDASKTFYDEDAENYYNTNYALFLRDIRVIDMLKPEDGTFTCTQHTEEKDSVKTSTLTFTFTAEGGTLTITAVAQNDLPQTISIVSNDFDFPENSRSFSVTITYGSAEVTTPDLDAWAREDAEKAARAEANQEMIDARDDFFSDALCADNVVVKVTSGENVLTETIADGIDRVDYGAYKTYTYIKDVDEETSDTYFVFEGEDAKYYMKNDETYDSNCLVFYNFFISVYDALSEDAQFSCDASEDAMTFTVSHDGETVLTLTATKTAGRVTAATLTVSFEGQESVTTFEFTYDKASLSEPDLTGFADASASAEPDVEE